MNEIVKYHNDLSDLPLRKFSASELDLLMVLCSKCKYQDTEPIKLSFREIKELANYKAKDTHQLAEDIRRTNKKLLELNIMLHDAENPGRTVQFALFQRFITDEKTKTLEVAVHKEFAFILNELSSNFTRFELDEFVKLKSSYSKACYRQLKRYRHTGFWTVSIEDFRRLLDVPKSYRSSELNAQVLKPIQQELSKIFKYFVIEKKFGSGRGKPLVGFEFHFEPERKLEPEQREKKKARNSSFVCPLCGDLLVEKVLNGSNCWCHEEGWKQEAKCSKIFNSIAEINGYDERPKDQKNRRGFFGKLF